VWGGRVRVRHPRTPLAPGDQAARERTILAALADDERGALTLLLERLGHGPTGWYGWPLVGRWAEVLAWVNLVSAAEARGLRRRAAEDAAAQQLGQHPDTLRTRLRPLRCFSPRASSG